MNGYIWNIRLVKENDKRLIDRTGSKTVATTDPINHAIYLSENLHGNFLMTVLIHELGHCALFSFHLIPEIRKMTYPEYWIDMEELICNILADYGSRVFQIAYSYLGYDAWKIIPKEYERYISA